jgi:hypothetical protein
VRIRIAGHGILKTLAACRRGNLRSTAVFPITSPRTCIEDIPRTNLLITSMPKPEPRATSVGTLEREQTWIQVRLSQSPINSKHKMGKINVGMLVSKILFRYLGRQHRQHASGIHKGKKPTRPGRYLGIFEERKTVSTLKNRILRKPHRQKALLAA